MATVNEQTGINVEEKSPEIATAVGNDPFTTQRAPSRTSINAEEKSPVTAPAVGNEPLIAQRAPSRTSINAEEKPSITAPALGNEPLIAQRAPSRTSINVDEKQPVTALADTYAKSPIDQPVPTQTVINVDGNPFGTPLTAAANDPLISQSKPAETAIHLNDKPLQIHSTATAAASEPFAPLSTPINTSVINDVTNLKSEEPNAVVVEQPSDLKATAADLLRTKLPSQKKKIAAVICGTSVSLFTLGIASIIPLLELIIGWHYADQCPVNWRIPHYLVVAGAVGLVLIILSITSGLLALVAKSKIKSTSTDRNPSVAGVAAVGCVAAVLSVVVLFLCIFCIGWFIAGCIWVFGAWNKVQYRHTTRANYCHPFLYRVAYFLLLLSLLHIVFTCVRNAFQFSKQMAMRKRGGAQLVPTTEP